MTSDGTKFTYKHIDNYEIETKLLGKYNVYNLLAVITLLSEFGLKHHMIEEIAEMACPD